MSKTSKSDVDVDDDGSWKKVMEQVKAAISNESLILDRLTRIAAEVFENFFAKKPTEHKKKRSLVEKSGTATSEEGNEEDYAMRKQKKQKTGDVEEKQKQKAGNGKQNQTKKKKVNALTELTELGLEPPPDMPETFKNCIANLGGTDVKLVIQKFIEKTDLTRQHNRLSMTMKQVRSMFLSKSEEQMLKTGIDVTVVEPCLEVSKLNLTLWTIGRSPTYIFNNQWHQLVRNNTDSLKPKAVVQIWSFRIPPDSKLGFAFIKVRDGKDGHRID